MPDPLAFENLNLKKSSRRLLQCAACGETKPHSAHGWCQRCFKAHSRAKDPNRFSKAQVRKIDQDVANYGKLLNLMRKMQFTNVEIATVYRIVARGMPHLSQYYALPAVDKMIEIDVRQQPEHIEETEDGLYEDVNTEAAESATRPLSDAQPCEAEQIVDKNDESGFKETEVIRQIEDEPRDHVHTLMEQTNKCPGRKVGQVGPLRQLDAAATDPEPPPVMTRQEEQGRKREKEALTLERMLGPKTKISAECCSGGKPHHWCHPPPVCTQLDNSKGQYFDNATSVMTIIQVCLSCGSQQIQRWKWPRQGYWMPGMPPLHEPALVETIFEQERYWPPMLIEEVKKRKRARR